ncbi:MAG: 3'-5' exonuclease, partial [archaeon]
MKGFIVYPTYKVIDERAYVLLYGRLENGESFCTVNYFRPYFYIRKEDLKKGERALENSENFRGAEKHGFSSEIEFETEENGFKTKQGDEVIKIIGNVPADVPRIRKAFSDLKIKCYEADIKFPYRFMIDNNINGCVDIEGSFIKENNIDRVYEEPEIKSCSYKPKLKVLVLDIETDIDAKKIFCISLVCDSYKKVLIVSDKKLKNSESFDDEESMLTAFVSEVNKLDPDVITGWNVIDFDLKVIQERCRKKDVPFAISRDGSKVKLSIEEDFFRDSKADVHGRVVLDGLNLLKGSFIKVNDYKLDTVAFQVLGEGKAVQFGNKGSEIQDMYDNNQQKLVDYNLKDSELVIKIIEKTGVLDLTVQRSMLTGMPPDRVNASIASFDSLYIKETKKRKLVVPTSDFAIERTEDTTGGYVRESEPGIYDFLIVLDFKSLYPSIIRTFNIDPMGLDEECSSKNTVKVPNGTCFKKDVGILPSLIEELWEHRE